MIPLQKIRQPIVIEGFNTIYYHEAGKHFTHPVESHDYWEMVYVDCGKVNALSNDKGYLLTQGQVIFHGPMDRHAHVSDNHTVNNTMVVAFVTHSECMDFFRGKIFNLDKTAISLLGLLFREVPDPWPVPASGTDLYYEDLAFGSGQLMQCYFTEFLIHLLRSAHAEKMNPNEESRNITLNAMSNPIAEYMQENIYENLTMDAVCSKFLISKSQLGKIFKAKLGKSPMEYYTELKITEAKRLLREQEHSITQIAELLGFSSIHTFSRTFKNVTRFSPSEYAQSIQHR